MGYGTEIEWLFGAETDVNMVGRLGISDDKGAPLAHCPVSPIEDPM